MVLSISDSKSAEEEKRATTVAVGGHIYSSSCPISLVRWHPLSSTGGTLIILSPDALRVFEIGDDPDTPEQTLNFSVDKSNGRGFYADCGEHSAISFCFGSSGVGWGEFCVYILMLNGDIYTACPLCPANIIAPKSLIEKLTFEVGEEKGPNMEENMRRQKRWINDVLGQISARENFGLTEWSTANYSDSLTNLVSFKRPSILKPEPFLQGPLLLKPAPMEYVASETQSADIASVQLGPVQALVVSDSTGKVDVLLQLCEISAVWSLGGGGPYELTTVESIRLPHSVPQQEKINLFPSLVEPNHLYTSNGFEIHVLPALQDALLVNEGNNLSSSLRDEPSTVTQLVDVFVGNKSTCINGIIEISDSILGDFVIVYMPNGDLFLKPLSEDEIHVEKQADIQLNSEVDETRDVSDENDFEYYTCSLRGSIYKIPQKLLEQHQKPVVPQNLRGKCSVTEDSLRFVGKVAQSRRQDLGNLQSAAIGMHARLVEQLKELERQKVAVDEIQKLWPNTNLEDMGDRVSACSIRQENLRETMKTLLRRLLAVNSVDLSDKEKNWFSELERIQVRLSGTKGWEIMLQRYRSYLNRLKESPMSETRSVQQQQEQEQMPLAENANLQSLETALRNE